MPDWLMEIVVVAVVMGAGALWYAVHEAGRTNRSTWR